MGRFGLVLYVLMLLPLAVNAADVAGRQEFVLKHHEFQVSTGIVPGRYSFGYDYKSPFDHFSFPGIYESSRYYEREYVSGVWSLGYTYNFTKVLAIQTNVFYESGWIDRFSREGDVKVAESLDSYLSAMASFKVSWYNRPAVRLYSYLGLGLSYKYGYNDPVNGLGQGTRIHDIVAAFQFTPLGVQFGRRLFGFAEIGIGHYFSGAAAGIGYRF